MPSKKCPECGRIVTSNINPAFCAWCGCSLAGQPILTAIADENKANPKTDTNNERINEKCLTQMKLF